MSDTIDLRVDLNTEDDTGLPWAFVRDARDPSLLREGAWLIVGSGNARAVAQVVQLEGDLVWVRPLPGPLMYAAVVAMIPLGMAIAAGFRTRLAAAAYLVVFTYCELIDAALYLNHYWYVTLALGLVAVLPLNGMWSVDARTRRVAPSPFVGHHGLVPR